MCSLCSVGRFYCSWVYVAIKLYTTDKLTFTDLNFKCSTFATGHKNVCKLFRTVYDKDFRTCPVSFIEHFPLILALAPALLYSSSSSFSHILPLKCSITGVVPKYVSMEVKLVFLHPNILHTAGSKYLF